VLRANDLANLRTASRGTGACGPALHHGAGESDLVSVPTRLPPLTRELWLVFHRDIGRSPAVRAVIDHIAAITMVMLPAGRPGLGTVRVRIAKPGVVDVSTVRSSRRARRHWGHVADREQVVVYCKVHRGGLRVARQHAAADIEGNRDAAGAVAGNIDRQRLGPPRIALLEAASWCRYT